MIYEVWRYVWDMVFTMMAWEYVATYATMAEALDGCARGCRVFVIRGDGTVVW